MMQYDFCRAHFAVEQQDVGEPGSGWTSWSALAAASMIAFSIGGISSAANAAGVNFAPHRAVYEITLATATAGSGVEGLSGRMVYEVNGSACDGYTQNMRFVSRMTNQENVETINDLRNSSFEDAKATRLRFSSTQFQNDKIAEASQGDAKRVVATGGATVDLTKPKKTRVTLPSDIHFPMQHAAALITAARNGQSLLAANLYDGAEKGDKYYLTSTAIGKKTERGAVKSNASVTGAGRLADVESWPMSISYFEPDQNNIDAVPAYELSIRYYENGVTGDLKIDYGGFAINGVLKELTFLEPSKCESSSQ